MTFFGRELALLAVHNHILSDIIQHINHNRTSTAIADKPDRVSSIASIINAISRTGLGLTLAAAGLAAGAANAFTLTPLPGFDDADFNNLLLNEEIAELFVAESRGGNNGLSGDREVGINQPIVPDGMGRLMGGLPFPGAQGQRTWPNGAPVPFVLSFDPISNLATYTVGTGDPSTSDVPPIVTLTATVGSEEPTAIYLRTRAQGNLGGTATNALTSLELDDGSGFQGIQDLVSVDSDPGPGADVDYFLVSDLNSPFTLRGLQTFSWTGGFPLRSQVGSQFKVVFDLDEPGPRIPEPGTLVGLVTVSAIALAGKFKKQA